MASGGITGTPRVFDGRGASAATTTPVRLAITNPIRPTRRTWARSLAAKNLDATNNLLITLNGQGPIVVVPGEGYETEAIIHDIVVASMVAPVEYQITLTVA